MTPRRRRGPVALCVLTASTLVVAAACSGSDDRSDESPVDPPTTVVTDGSTTIAVAPSTTATTTTTTTLPGPPLAERFSSIEVSARVVTATEDRVVTISVDDALADLPDPGDPAGAAAWCSGVIAPVSGPYVVRITESAVDRTEGGITGFELVALDPPIGLDGGIPVPAELRVALESGPLVATDATLTITPTPTGDPAAGAFRGVTDEGTVVEGAFRCA